MDADAIWEIFHAVVASGDTYAYSPDTTFDEMHALWMSPPAKTFVAVQNDRIVGTYLLRANAPGLGGHVANAGYMVHPGARGLGVGRVMCRHSLEVARDLGFRAMQFNFVVSTNERAIAIWKQNGFAIIGTIPKGFAHARLGLVDVYIMHRCLTPTEG